MKEIKTSEGFLVMKTTNAEFAKATRQDGCLCDDCCAISPEGYYVAAINRWLCPQCYIGWKKTATRYSKDVPAEESNCKFYKERILEES